jgi:hypothetical protein
MHRYKKTAHYSWHFRTPYKLKSRHFFRFDAGSIEIPNLTVNNESASIFALTRPRSAFMLAPSKGIL